MPQSAKKWSKKALLGAALGVTAVAVFPFLSGAQSGGGLAAKYFIAEPDLEKPMVTQSFERGPDRFRLLVSEAAKNPGIQLKFEKNLTVRRGQTLMETLTGAGVSRREAYYAIEALSKTLNPRKIQTGQDLQITLEKSVFSGPTEAKLAKISMPVEFGETVVVNRLGEDKFASKKAQEATRSLKMYAEGTIEDSLYLSALQEGVPLGVVSELIRLFSFDVDFQRQIWPGDQFKVFYERRLTPEGKAENTGKVLAATLILRGEALTFYRFDKADGRFDYYTIDGKSARKMLMKTPIDGARISGRFGMRKHPILGYSRMHKGVDFAANTGTPVYAAGDGTIERASKYGGYGNYIKIRHNSNYSTGYGHLSGYARGIHSGVRVTQGQVIGYVGMTGLATGPHLHYEIYRNGTQINPLTLKMPTGESLKAEDVAVLKSRVAVLNEETRMIQAFLAPGPDSRPDNGIVTVGD